MITQNEIARKDFDRVCELNGYETFTEKQVTSLSTHIKGLIEKSSREQLAPDEIQSIHAFNEDLPELKKALVLNNDMTREVVFYRERQVIFDDSIEKSEDGEIMKARGGVYANTAQNRKAGRVGQKYGGKKVEGEEKKEDNVNSVKERLDKLTKEVESLSKTERDKNGGMSDKYYEVLRDFQDTRKEYNSLLDKERSKKESTEKKEGGSVDYKTKTIQELTKMVGMGDKSPELAAEVKKRAIDKQSDILNEAIKKEKESKKEDK